MEEVISLDGRSVKLVDEGLAEFNVQNLLEIDYSILAQEIAKFPYVLNQVNNLFVEAENLLRKENFNLEVIKDNLSDLKSRLSFATIEILKARGIKSPTIQNIEDEISQNPEIKALKDQIKHQKEVIITITEKVNKFQSLYWSCKAKMDCLINLSNKVVLTE